jgi:hypothetical protein
MNGNWFANLLFGLVVVAAGIAFVGPFLAASLL